MRAGSFVEELTVEMLQAGIAVDPYTQQLLHSSEGYVEHHLEEAARAMPIHATAGITATSTGESQE
jgi:hypothetical protein